jgi:hypothetical protein
MSRRVQALAGGLSLALLLRSAPVDAGCGVPEPELWSPAGAGHAPLDARITLSLGGFAGLLRDVELRPRGGRPISVQRRELPGPVGHTLIQLVPDAPLQPGALYELVARRPASWHPNQWVFGAFTTGNQSAAAAPSLRVLAARYLEREGSGLPARRWIELDLSTATGSSEGDATLFAVWLPSDRAPIALDAAPSVYLPRDGDRLRISSPELCAGRHVPLPAALGRAEIAVAALDAAGHQSQPERVAIDFAHPTRQQPE